MPESAHRMFSGVKNTLSFYCVGFDYNKDIGVMSNIAW